MRPSLFVILVVVGKIDSFYLPGVAPVTYCETPSPTGVNRTHNYDHCNSNEVTILANRLNSPETVLPYNYERFDFCLADIIYPAVNFGQTVFGDRFILSPYKLRFRHDVLCQQVCTKTYLPGNKNNDEQLDFLKKAISLNYQHHWVVDNIPVTWCYMTIDGNEFCSLGFPVGCQVTSKGIRRDACVMNGDFKDNDTCYVFNHVDITIKYHPEDGEESFPIGGRIISAKIQLRSIKHVRTRMGDTMCDTTAVQGISGGDIVEQFNIRYTYSVKWKADYQTMWSSRWDYILEASPNSNILWFSLVNSTVLVLFMMGMACIIFWRQTFCLRRTLNKVDNSTCWQLISGDVFRPPRRPLLLTALVGNGVQVFFAALFTLVLGAACFLSPANRGSLGMVGLVMLFTMGGLAGYSSARLYKSFAAERRKLNVAITTFLFPGIMYVVFLLLNLLSWIEGSSAALPFSTLCSLTALWLGVSSIFTAVGVYFGYRKKPFEYPVETNEIARPLPRQKLWTRPFPSLVIGAILPFGCIFVQAFFILNAMWGQQVYYMFGFLLMSFVMLTLTCCMSTMLLCYFHLRAEDYHWWWRSFLMPAGTGVYLFIYSIHYYFTRLELQGVSSAILYFGYMLLIAFLVCLLTGAVGFYACFWMVKKIYLYEVAREKSALTKEKTTFENLLEGHTDDKMPLTASIFDGKCAPPTDKDNI